MGKPVKALPIPTLCARPFGARAVSGVTAYTDDALFEACGVRIAFTTRAGGVSAGPYASLNLGSHVKDDPAAVEENRRILLNAFCGAVTAKVPLIVPNQVHGDNVLVVRSAQEASQVAAWAAEGADALVVEAAGVAANLCFADCCPLIAVAPTGQFAVIHAGWRGVGNLISVKSVRLLAEHLVEALGASVDEALAQINVYIGAHIHAECFETGAEIHKRFTAQFGDECAFDGTHIDLNFCLRKQLTDAGISANRIADVGKCTVCNNEEFFSYRAQGGTCGRHGAFALRM